MVGAGMLANVARQSHAACAGAAAPATREPVSDRTFAVLAGGGTGGHVYPAIALAQELVARGPRARRRSGSSAAGAGPKAGSSPTRASRSICLPGRGLQRRLTLANIGVFVETVVAFVARVRLGAPLPPAASSSGSAATRRCRASSRRWFWRIPRVVHEQDSVIGLANRIGVRLGARVAASLPGVDAPDVVLTGQPGARRVPRSRAPGPGRRRSSPRSAARSGAGSINRAALGLLRPLARPHRRRRAPRHAARATRRSAPSALDALRRAGDALAYELVGYEPHMPALFERATRRGLPGRRGHRRRAHRGRVARGARAAPGRAERPPGAQRRDARRAPARPSSCPTPSATRRASTRSSSELLADPERLDAMASAARGLAPSRRRGPARRPRRGASPDDADARRRREPSTCPRSTSTAPRTIHIVGVGGVGMSAIALLLARMGHRVSGSDIKDCDRARAARGGRRRRAHRQPRRDTCPRDADAVVYSTAVPLGNVELVAARERGHPRAAPRRRARARIVGDAPTRSRSPVRTGRRRRRRCSRSSCAKRAGSPSFLIGGELNEVGTNAAYGDGEWLVVEADESDGTFLQHRARRPRSSRTSSPTTSTTTAGSTSSSRAFERFVDAVPGPVVCGIDDAVGAAIAASRPRRPHLRRRIPTPTTASSTTAADRTACRFTLVADGDRLGELVVPLGVKAATNAAGAAAMALELGVEFDAVVACAARLRWRRPPVPVPRRARRRRVRRRLRAPPDRGRGRDRDRARVGRRTRDRRVPAAPLHPHRLAVGATSPMRSSAPTRCSSPTCTRRGRSRSPGVSGRLVAQAVRERHPDARRLVRARARATSPTLPDATRAAGRRRPDARRGRPHHDARRLARVDEDAVVDASTDVDRRARRARCPGGCERDASSAALTTYRCGGPLAALVRVDDEDDLRRVADVLGGTDVGGARRRSGLEPPRRRHRLRRDRARARRHVRAARRRRPGGARRAPAARSRCRCSPAGRRRPGSAASSSSSASPDRSAARSA